MAKVAIRFDIDSHKCIRDGVPLLLKLSSTYDVPFTFYLNAGRAVSILDTIKTRLSGHTNDDSIKMLSAREKLGTMDFLYAAIINPKMTRYKENIKAIWNSNCELGIHGGMNHSHWYVGANQWSEDRIRNDVVKAIDEIRKIIPEYELQGFAAPGFVTSERVEKVLKELGFSYSTNWNKNGAGDICKVMQDFSTVGVNLCGEPGGVAYWEHAVAAGWSDAKMIDEVLQFACENDEVLLFDHPYFVALQKISLLEETIKRLILEGHKLLTVRELL